MHEHIVQYFVFHALPYVDLYRVQVLRSLAPGVAAKIYIFRVYT